MLPFSPCLQVVKSVSHGLSSAQVAQVAATCQGLPLLLKVVADALCSGRVTMRELQDALLPTPTADAGTAGGRGGAGAGGDQVLQMAGLKLALMALPKQQQEDLLQLTVFPSDFDMDAAQAVLGMDQAYRARTVVHALYRYSLVAYNAAATGQQYSLHMAVRQQAAAVLQVTRGQALLAEAGQRYVLHMLTLMGMWARLAAAGSSVNMALSLAREQQAGVDALMARLASPAQLTSETAKGVAAGLTTELVLDLLDPLGMATSPGTLTAMECVLSRLQQVNERGKEGKLLRANAYEAVGIVQWKQGRFVEAQRQHEQALQLRTEALGDRASVTIESMSSLAWCFLSQGQQGLHRDKALLIKAQALHEKVLLLRTQVLGAEHPDTIASMNGVACCFKAQDQHAKAQPQHEKVLQLRTKVLGAKHPRTISSVDNLAICLDHQGQHAEAQALHEKAVALRTEVLGARHPDTILALNKLAGCFFSQGQHDMALSLYKKVLKLRTEVLGQRHPENLETMNSLAKCLSHLGGAENEGWAQELREQADES